MWEFTGADREASDLGPGARRRAAEKRHPDPLMPRAITYLVPYLKGKGDSQENSRYRSDKALSVCD